MSKTSSPQWSRLKLKTLLQKISSTLKDPICLLAFIILLCSNSFGKEKEGLGNFPEKAEKLSTAYGINHGTFNLINSLTDQVITSINDGDTFYLDVVGDSLNIQAVPSQSYTHVKFIDDLGYERQEGVAPYAYKADTAGDYWNWTPALGSLTMTVEYINSGTVVNTDTFTITFQQSAPDTQAPSSIADLTTSNITENSVQFNWTAVTDNVGVVAYRLYNQDIFHSNLGNVTSYELTSLNPGTTYNGFTVRAYDAAGNEAADSNSVVFTTTSSSGGNSGNYWTQSGTDIYYNDGNVGIGTDTPTSRLSILDPSNNQLELINSGTNLWQFRVGSTGSLILKDDGVESLRINESGNVGIGNTSPDSKLSIAEATNNQLELINTTGNQWQFRAGSTGSLIFKDDGAERLRIDDSGNVGIGTTNPGIWKLAVNGNIRAKEVKVETGWADYVFKDDYDLPSLDEVERYIEENGHLVNIPSAAEVKANGIFLGEINKLLLEKIEELTLYTIQQEKKISKLEEENKRLKLLEKRIAALEHGY